MTYSRDELTTFPLQKLASMYPQTLEEENVLKEVFEQRARVSSYFTLTSLVDIRAKWQEDIIQTYADELRTTMAPENPVELTPEQEAQLEPGVVTKEKELELQAILDKKNGRKVAEPEVIEAPEEVTEPAEESAVIPEETPAKKVTSKKK